MNLENLISKGRKFFIKSIGAIILSSTLLTSCPNPTTIVAPVSPTPNQILQVPKTPSLIVNPIAREPNRLMKLIISDNSDNEDGFVIERKIDNRNFSPLVDLPANEKSYNDSRSCYVY